MNQEISQDEIQRIIKLAVASALLEVGRAINETQVAIIAEGGEHTAIVANVLTGLNQRIISRNNLLIQEMITDETVKEAVATQATLN